ncbi:transcription and mRNA export factor ENY2-like [Schistocerca gregaria]|uniref:transcription and mRNA export factor ENY2-like n=1 Tax=Schistocerca gregaria TaxID=7010 RepID=UPI00211E3398|nr:transcription and mRNA export factor ENY2-like [Schistocerca gregaria]
MLHEPGYQQKFIMSGEKERFKELLRTRLIESGWRDQILMHCRQIVKERGVQNITAEQLISEVTPKGRALVPDAVKKELLQKIKNHFSQAI